MKKIALVLIGLMLITPCAFAIVTSRDVSSVAPVQTSIEIDEDGGYVATNDAMRIASFNAVQILKTSSGVLHSINLTSGDRSGVPKPNSALKLDIYDSNTGATGSVIARIYPSLEQSYIFDSRFETGLTVDKFTSADVTIVYR